MDHLVPAQRSSSTRQGTFQKAVPGSGKQGDAFPFSSLGGASPHKSLESSYPTSVGPGPREVVGSSGGPSPTTHLWQDGQGGARPCEQAAEEAQALDSSASSSMTHPVSLGESPDL